MLAVFAERGPGEGEIAHYVSTDGSGGLIIADVDDPQAGYANALDRRGEMQFWQSEERHVDYPFVKKSITRALLPRKYVLPK